MSSLRQAAVFLRRRFLGFERLVLVERKPDVADGFVVEWLSEKVLVGCLSCLCILAKRKVQRMRCQVTVGFPKSDVRYR